ncbi:MAG: LacI family DNA-binding transcriptional regulator [Rhizobiaceae bacterium]|jgi:LacI family transcriptional regulator
MAKQKVSIKQVADAAGVSIATVSNVFSGKKPVKSELANQVRMEAERLGYRVNRAASNLRSGESKIVPILVPDMSDPFFTSLIMEIEKQAHTDGFEIIVANTKDDVKVEHGRISALMSWQPAGMIVVPVSDDVPEQFYKLRNELPIVLVDRGTEIEGFDTIRVNNARAGAQSAEHLAQLGHRRLLIVASDLRLHGVRERCRGAVEQFEANGGSAEIVEVGPVPQQGAEHIGRWLDAHQIPTAIFAVTDMTTLAALTCLAERKLEVSKDVALVGFDDYPWMSARRTPITAVRQPIEKIAAAAWMKLKNGMSGKDNAAISRPLCCTMEIRASTLDAPDSSLSDGMAPKIPIKKLRQNIEPE